MSRFHDEFFRQKGPKHDQLVMRCVREDSLREILEKIYPNGIFPRVDYETEVICKNRDFIIGYADIVIRAGENLSEAEIESKIDFLIRNFHLRESEARSSVRRYSRPDEYQYHVLVECKPELTDVGATLRQLKTYESILACIGNLKKVIATYDTPTKDVSNYLNHEGVDVVVFEGGD